jgi:hypothetical protein
MVADRGDRRVSKRRSSRAQAVDARLRAQAEAMLEADETLTARALARRAGLSAASSITRDPTRRTLLQEFQQKQEHRRGWVVRSKKESLDRLRKALAQRDEQLRQLTTNATLLTASHKAMLLAVDEAGGTKAWAKFFSGWRASVQALREALPTDLSPEIDEVRHRKLPRKGWRRY